MKAKLLPRQRDPPTAKRDSQGNIITKTESLKQLYLDTYTNRLQPRVMKSEFKEIYHLKTKLWSERLKVIRLEITPCWKEAKLNKVIKSLKKKQTRDPNGMVNELFLPGVMGKDLESALIMLMNGVKSAFYIPHFLELADITSLFKMKGSRMDLVNDRGIFILSVIREILDKLIYQDKYDDIAQGMSDSNIGAQKKKGIKNHLFVVYGIINSVLYEEKSCIDIQIYDIIQAFDSLWLDDCMNDLYDTLPAKQRDDKLALMYDLNVNTAMAVNTPVGQTDRRIITKTVQQGGVFGPIQCSNTIDKIGKKCYDEGKHLFLYKKMVNVLPLSMCDDLLAISRCGHSSLSMNTYINTQIELKKLKFHTPNKDGKTKCHKLHIGKKDNMCPELKVHGTTMVQVTEDTYLGDIISSDGKNKKNIQNRIAKGTGIISQIMTILERVTLGEHYFATALLLRESLFLNSILTNADIWYAIQKEDLDQLEELDISLLRQIMGATCTVATEALYLELGCVNIGAILKGRRANYLHYLVSQSNDTMLSKFFNTQWRYSIKHDWTEQVKLDLKDLDISEDLQWIKSKSSGWFKNHVRRKVREFAFYQFLEEKESHRKLENLFYSELKLQNYLKLQNMNTSEAKTVFAFRSRSAPYKENYRGRDGHSPCPMCLLHLDCQSLALQCPTVLDNVLVEGKYNDIFKDNINENITKTLVRISKFREEYLNNRNLQ